MTFVAEIDDPRLAPYRHQFDRKRHAADRWFVAEGRFLVERLLATDWEMHSILVDDAAKVPPIPPHRIEQLPIYGAPRAAIQELVGFNFHRGVMAAGCRPERTEVTDERSLGETSWTVVAAANIGDAENLGSIIRTACGFGAAAILLDSRCVDPYSRRALRVSTGHAFKIPIVESADFVADLEILRQRHQATLYATVLDEHAQPLSRVVPSPRSVILVGNEGFGLDRYLIDACQHRVTIPMRRGSDSLNVAMATGICLYHFCGRDPFT
ncbi:MAG: RNA methyltransferase [Pirellulaceae bacterium]